MENPNTSPGRDLLAGLGELFNDERAAGVVARLLFGLLDHVNLHCLPLFVSCVWESNLLARFGQLFDDERAAGVAGLFVCLLDDLNLHHLKSPQCSMGVWRNG